MDPSAFVRLSDRAAYLAGGTNIGLIDGDGGSVLVDAGNDKDAARRIQKAAEAYGRKLSAAALTHSNADHAGGAAAFAARAGIPIFAPRLEASICADPILEPSFLWGGFPPVELRGKFFVAPACEVTPFPFPADAEAESLAGVLEGIRALPLGGHFFAQVGYIADDVLFAGDAVFGEESIGKHPAFFLYDVAAFLASLDRIVACGARLVVPSHGRPTEDPAALAAINRRGVERVADAILSACAETTTAEGVLAAVAAAFSINLDWAQYALVGSTVRSYLVYLRGLGKLEAEFGGGYLRWTRA